MKGTKYNNFFPVLN